MPLRWRESWRKQPLPIWSSDIRTVLEKEIAEALRDGPTDDWSIADLKFRKRIIANEILHYRRLVERFSKRIAH